MDIDENAGQGTPPAQQPNGGGGNDGGGGGGGGGAGPADIEQFLLHQFSRMGTTDHDELVNQLQKVLGNQLNYNTARFFLDMNNWYVFLASCLHRLRSQFFRFSLSFADTLFRAHFVYRSIKRIINSHIVAQQHTTASAGIAWHGMGCFALSFIVRALFIHFAELVA